MKRRGQQFYDASGAMIASVTTDIKKAEFGPVHVLVQAQGNAKPILASRYDLILEFMNLKLEK